MRLYLAVAVLLLALVAYTEAQDQTFQERFQSFTQQVTDATRDLGDQTSAAFESFKNSEFAEKFRGFFSGIYESSRKAIEDLSQQ
ncbi:apolipoprotein C-I [Aulostomus maculatus]